MKQLYTTRDIAETLGVSLVAVNGWVKGELEGKPPPVPHAWMRAGGLQRFLWTEAGVKAWKKWYAERVKHNPYWRSNTWHSRDAELRQSKAEELMGA